MRSAFATTTALGVSLPTSLLSGLQRALPAEVTLLLVDDIDDLRIWMAHSGADCLVYAVPELTKHQNVRDEGLELLRSVHRALRGPLRGLPAAALCHAEFVDVRLLEEFRDLEHVHLVPLDSPSFLDGIWPALEQVLSSGLASTVYKRIGSVGPSLLREFLRAALPRATRNLQTGDVARELNMHERTLRRRLIAESGITPQELVGWARILVAAWHLRLAGRSIQDVADTLGFSAPSNLHRQIRHLTGLSLPALRDSGDLLDNVVMRYRTRVSGAVSERAQLTREHVVQSSVYKTWRTPAADPPSTQA